MKPRSRFPFLQCERRSARWKTWRAIALVFVSATLVTSCRSLDTSRISDWILLALRSEQTDEVAHAILEIQNANPDPDWVAAQLRQGLSYIDAESGWAVHYRMCTDGRKRAFHVYVPPGYDPAIPSAVLFDLHGGRMGEPTPPQEHYAGRTIWQPSADKLDLILIYPQGDAGATWFDDVGQENLLGQFAYVKRNYNIDENRVFMSGYSAGGAGTMWQAFHHPTPWAGFLVFSGYYDVGGMGRYPVFARNLLNRSFHATSGLYDGAIPIETVEPFVTQYQAMGIDFSWQIYPVAHNVSFVNWERPRTERFLTEIVRNPLRTHVVWETASPETGRCDWVRIDEIEDVGNNASFPEMSVFLEPDSSDFGVALAYQSDGTYRVAGVRYGSIAQQLGIESGDRIAAIDGKPVRTATEMDAAVLARQPGESIEVEAIRAGDTRVLVGSIPRGESAYSAANINGTIEVSSVGNRIDVRVRHVAQFTLFLSSEQFNLSQPLEVYVNEQIVFDDAVQPDLRFMLEQAVVDLDRETVYEAVVTLAVPADSKAGHNVP